MAEINDVIVGADIIDVEENVIAVLVDNNIEIDSSEPEYEITINRKEYNVVGDELYIPKRYEDAPQWLRDIIDNVTDVALSAKINDINNLTQSLNNLIVELEVAKNTYTMSVISSNDINERINTAIETLNSSVMESDATILGLATTRVTPEQAQAISIDAIRTSLNDTISGNSLGSIISEINATTTTGDYTNAQSIEVLKSTVEGNADATATAIDTINTFAGIDGTGAYTYTGLTGYLVDPNTGMIGGGQSELQNTITTTGDSVEAKFEYGSNIKIGGKYHNAGFGLKTTMTGGDGTTATPYNSEFWIDAQKFKFTNSGVTGQSAPFVIDATGTEPKVTFNGIVDFTNTNSANGYEGTTTLNGGLITTNSVKAQQIDSYAITGKYITGGNIDGTNINGVNISGSVINGTTINGARINGAVIRASYLDLDGELEVLTNYHISVALRNSNPGYFVDAVYIAADNEYRIPSTSIVTEVSTGFTNGTAYGTIRSFNTSNAGHNLKAVKIRPVFQNINGNILASNVESATLRVGGVVVGTFTSSGSNPSSNGYNGWFSFSSPYTSGFSVPYATGDSFSSTPEELFRSEVFVSNVPAFCDLRVELVVYGSCIDGDLNHWQVFNIYTAGGSSTLPFEWSDPNARINISGSNVRIAGIQINNMI